MTFKKYFPYPKIRDIQQQSLDFIANNIDKYKFIVIQGPTGTGKSAIALTLARWMNNHYKSEVDNSYLITTQKILQEQYINDFPEIANIWSKSNYQCQHRKKMSCEEGQRLCKIFSKSKESYKCMVNCIYTNKLKYFLVSPVGITNIAYLFNQVVYNTNPNTAFPKRKLLVIDECHNLEQAVVDFICTRIEKTNCELDFHIKYPEDFNNNLELSKKWIETEYLPVVQKRVKQIEDDIKSNGTNNTKNRLLLKDYNMFDKMACKTKRFIDNFDPDNWVITYTDSVFEIKPIHAGVFTQEILFGLADRILLMSGTILNHKTFCENAGIPIEESCFLSLDSPFPVKNRPIVISPMVSMSYKNIDNNLPIMHKSVQSILSQHKGQKGIIHAHTYNIAKYLKAHDKTGRLLIHDSSNRKEIFNKHIKSSSDTVLVSPSLTEGVDLVEDFSRFQIVCKIPFPYLKDNYILTKMKRCPLWYEWQTVKTIIQELGRSVRSENDYAISYILDEDWNYFYKKNKFMFPEWFTKAFVYL